MSLDLSADTLVDMPLKGEKGNCGFVIDENFSPLEKKIINEDLSFLLGIKGQRASSKHEKFFGSPFVSGQVYCNYLSKNLIKLYKMKYDEKLSKRLSAINSGYSGLIGIYDRYFELSRVSRLGTLIHEARHTSGYNSSRHIICPNNYTEIYQLEYLEGLYACDSTSEGSYGYEFVWYSSIAQQCENCSMDDKLNALREAIVVHKRIADF